MKHLLVGHRYLVSTADLATLSTTQSVAWELLAKGDLRLVREYRGRGLASDFSTPTTLAEAIHLVAPDALPRTDVGEILATDTWHTVALLLAAVAGVSAWCLRSRSRTSIVGHR